MTATTFRQMSRQSVEAAPALEFPEPAPAASYAPPQYPKRIAAIRMNYHGVPVELTLPDRKIEEVEALIDGLLARDGWQLPAQAAAIATPAKPARPPELNQAPHYKDDGTPCCPIHKRPLKEGQHGSYCPAKAEAPIGNDKGFCRYSWKED